MPRLGYYYDATHQCYVSELMSKIIWIMLSRSIYLWRVFWALENENEIICYQNRNKTIIQIVPFHKPKLDADWALANAIKVLGIFSTRHPSTWLRVFWSGYCLKIFMKLSGNFTTLIERKSQLYWSIGDKVCNDHTWHKMPSILWWGQISMS